MKYLLFLPLVILFSSTSSSCNFSSEKELFFEDDLAMDEYEHNTDYLEMEAEGDSYAVENSAQTSKTAPYSNTNDRLKYWESIDKSFGIPSAWYPVPKNWNTSTEEGYTLKGPNNIKLSGVFGKNFQFTNNQQMAWQMQQYGQQIVPPMSIDQIVQQFFAPTAQQTNRTLTKKYELPEVANTTLTFMNQLFVSLPTRREAKSYALEWKDDKGMSYLTIVTINIMHSSPSSSWFFQGQYIEAPNAHFEQAKKDFIYMASNIRFNPQWIAACNQRDARRAGIAWQKHQGRMAAIKARGQASLNVGKIYSEISDINHAGYLKRNDINSNGHAKTVRGIGERTIIGNHNTGEHYNVASGSKYYWVNNNGEYFGTDNSLYDPRIDNRVNHTEWTQFNAEQ